MNSEETDVHVLRVAVIGRDGNVEYKSLPTCPDKADDTKGTVVYPFKNTNVISSTWKASEHVKFLKDEE